MFVLYLTTLFTQSSRDTAVKNAEQSIAVTRVLLSRNHSCNTSASCVHMTCYRSKHIHLHLHDGTAFKTIPERPDAFASCAHLDLTLFKGKQSCWPTCSCDVEQKWKRSRSQSTNLACSSLSCSSRRNDLNIKILARFQLFYYWLMSRVTDTPFWSLVYTERRGGIKTPGTDCVKDAFNACWWKKGC